MREEAEEAQRQGRERERQERWVMRVERERSVTVDMSLAHFCHPETGD